jgi:hypothetical protein
MVLRRLDRRLRFNDVATLEDYVPLLESSASGEPGAAAGPAHLGEQLLP